MTRQELHNAISQGNERVVSAILESGIDFNDPGNADLLDEAVYKGNVPIVELIIRAGGDVHREDQLHETPLFYAILHPRVLGLLIALGADVNHSNKWGSRPLHMAAANAPKAIPKLVQAGADAEARDAEGRTALHIACDLAGLAAVKELLKAGADVHARDSAGFTPLRHSVTGKEKKRLEIVRLLHAHGAVPTNEDLLGAAMHGASLDVVKELINLGCDPKYKDTLGRTALDYARRFSEGRHLLAYLKQVCGP